jgi:hypothetical protein
MMVASLRLAEEGSQEGLSNIERSPKASISEAATASI